MAEKKHGFQSLTDDGLYSKVFIGGLGVEVHGLPREIDGLLVLW